MSNSTTKDKLTEKIIQLDNPKSVELAKENFLLEDEYLEFAEKLVIARVNEITEYITNHGKDDNKEYRQLRMHDMIMVAGRRGSGKTTFLMNLRRRIKEHDTLQKEVKVLNIIDPTLLHGNSDILLLVLAGIYTKITEDFKKDSNKSNKKNQFNTIKEHLQKLHRTINLAYKFKKDADLEEDNYDRLHGLHKGLELDKDLHEFFKLVCDYYGVKALILPIDDIDMDFEHGYDVLDAIRKYLSTPRVLPISSMDIQQAHSIIKKKQYEYFGYKANTSKYDIKEKSELKFLRKLPEEFLTKISLPTRRIVLPDMLSIFENYIEKKVIFNDPSSIKKEESKFQYIYFIFTNSNQVRFKIELEDIVKYYVNIVYNANIDNSNMFRKISYSDYLGNKSVRSFFEDIRSFFNCIITGTINEQKQYQCVFDKKSLLKRYLPYSSVKYKTKYDAVLGLWSNYIKLTTSQIDSGICIFNNVSRTYEVSGKDHDNTVKTKTYMRLFLQDFYIDKITIDIEKKNENCYEISKIHKSINVAGAMELSMRTFIPQYLFENIYKENHKDIYHVNLKEFESFATDDLKTISDKLSMMHINLLNKDDNKNIMGGIKLSSKEYHNFPDISSYFLTENSNNASFHYLSSFKIIAEIIELLQSKSDFETRNIMKRYFNYKKKEDKEYNKILVKEYKRIKRIFSNGKNIINFEDSSFGLKEMSLFSNKLVNNILLVIEKNKIVRDSNDIEVSLDRFESELKEKLLNINNEINKNKKEESNIFNKIKMNKKLEDLKQSEYLYLRKDEILNNLEHLEKERFNIHNKINNNSLLLSKQKEFFIYITSFFNHFLITLNNTLKQTENRMFDIIDERLIIYGISSYDRKDYWSLKLPISNHPLYINISLMKDRDEMKSVIDLVKRSLVSSLSMSEIANQTFDNNAKNKNT